MEFNCPVCDSKEYNSEMACIDYSVSKESFDIVSCKGCGLWQTYPAPSESKISAYYDSENYISHSDKKETFFEKIYHLVRNYTTQQKVNLIKSYVPHGTILDFGCGTAYFLDKCKKSNFKSYGVEPNKNARDLAIKKEIEVFNDLESLLVSKLNFDVITLWHVLEHLHKPDYYIDNFYQLLNDRGILVLALPNRLSYDAFFYKNYWAGYDVPRHLFHFTKNDVIKLTYNKFQLLDIYPMYFDSFYVSILSEKYKKSKFPFLKGIIRGSISNIQGVKTQQFSSLIYVLQKN